MSVKGTARIAGGLWLACIVTGVLGMALSAPIIVRADVAATAANLAANETSMRLAIVANLLAGATYLGVTALLYYILRPVSASASFCAALFGAVGVAIGCLWPVAAVGGLALFRGGGSGGGLTPGQLQHIGHLAVGLSGEVFFVSLLFFGVQCTLAGALIGRSAFLPRVLGVMLAAGGMAYVLGSLSALLLPGAGTRILPFVAAVALLGEGMVTVWFLARGVDERRWAEQAAPLPALARADAGAIG